MISNDHSLNPLLAILQQAEYDLTLFRQWLQAEDTRTPELRAHVIAAQPEKWTAKLKLIRLVASLLRVVGPAEKSIIWATQLTRPLDTALRSWSVWRARRKLRRLQNQGLQVIGIAGSFGKTSTKHALYHALGHYRHCLMTPASFNTPLGIAQTILRKLTSRHDCFLVELGEYQPGDLDMLLHLFRPDTVVVTPIGFAHLERFGSKDALIRTFQELSSSNAKSATLLIDDTNREYFAKSSPDQKVFWYGTHKDSTAQLKSFTPDLTASTGKLRLDQVTKSFSTPLLSEHQVRNILPAFLLLNSWEISLEKSIACLQYHPTISRRLEVHRNPNGTVVIDNSYNTNPAAWKEMYTVMESLQIKPLAIISAGFVELDETTAKKEHQQLAKDLCQLADVVGIIKTRSNQPLIDAIQKSRNRCTLLTGVTTQDILQDLSRLNQRVKYIWLEGGCRELYQ